MKTKILTELETIAAAHQRSLARFGDGELRLAIGGACSSQRANKSLAVELRRLLTERSDTLVGIPNFQKTPNRTTWDRYNARPFASLYRLPLYGSAFITRPDNAPWIDNAEYWDACRNLWRRKDVVLVCGDRKSLREEEIRPDAKSVRVVMGPRQHAFDEIGRIDEEIGKPSGVVILCLGATATVLADRLDRKDIHALDLGHLGMFMRHAGAYAFKPDELATKIHRGDMAQIPWDRPRWADELATKMIGFGLWEVQARTILDYGCGSQWLSAWVAAGVGTGGAEIRVHNYDIRPGFDGMPKPADLVVGLDVLNWVEPPKRQAVLRHMMALAKGGLFLSQPDPGGDITADIQVLVRESRQWRARIVNDDYRADVWLTRVGS